jgi:ribulose-5-phosphate 4-epimerase/fuculose-1-phosphate aldolase
MLDQPKQTLRVESMREKVSPAEWQARVDTAACYRLVALYGMDDIGANHISMRVPGEDNNFLINPYGMMYDEITASSLIKIDIEGNIVGKTTYGDFDFGINRAGFVIHAAVHKHRHDANCVIHTHTWPGMAISSLECGLMPLTQTAMRFTHISYHDYNGVVLNESEQDRLVRDLGANNAMILRNHGLLTTGNSIGEAFNTLHRLEKSCMAQLAAMACNTPFAKVPQAVLDETYMNYQPGTRRPYGLMEWPAMLRQLDRRNPGYDV